MVTLTHIHPLLTALYLQMWSNRRCKTGGKSLRGRHWTLPISSTNIYLESGFCEVMFSDSHFDKWARSRPLLFLHLKSIPKLWDTWSSHTDLLKELTMARVLHTARAISVFPRVIDIMNSSNMDNSRNFLDNTENSTVND